MSHSITLYTLIYLKFQIELNSYIKRQNWFDITDKYHSFQENIQFWLNEVRNENFLWFQKLLTPENVSDILKN